MSKQLFNQIEGAAIGHSVALQDVLAELTFNADGLLPAVAQDASTRDVLMLAWMNREAIERTLAEGFACYWSRSRQAFWRKGETSGHLQALKELRFDCDGDAILLLVDQTGPACHTDRPSCFYLLADGDQVRVTSEPG
ncbi:MAG: phosphoribosyl-AMP cyclohydrolase [Gammaproteobacteria bacterium]|nr:phosphoribosyl-AMP cyclohydrolase [Gammaproteobacteria bacterium]